MKLIRKLPAITGKKGPWWVVVDKDDNNEALAAFTNLGDAKLFVEGRERIRTRSLEIVEAELAYG
jgi:hypothetical protein